MSKIIVGVSRPKAFFEPFSWAIRLLTWSPYSHAYIRFYSEEYQREVIWQASGAKLNFIGQAMFDSAEDIFEEFVVPVSADSKKLIIQGAIDKCGTKYGIGQVMGFPIILLFLLFGKKIKNPFYSTGSYFCSELTTDILMQIDQGASGLDPGTMTPADVFNFLVSRGFKPVSARTPLAD